jgi:hypothetical protein
MRLATASALALALIGMLPAGAPAQTYPSRTVSVIVPFPAGGSVDGVARILVAKLNETVGQHFIVENRAGGASGTVGANAVAKAAPDGYTLLLSASVHVINPFLYKSVPYDVVNDFTPVSLLADGPLLVSTTPSVPANNLKDFFDLVRKEPTKYTFGTTSVGSASHLAIELIKRDAGLDTLVVPYKGTAPALTDLVSDPAAGRSHALVAAAGAGRQDQGARHHQPQAHGRRSQYSDGRRIGRHQGIRIRVLVWPVGAEEPAGRRFRQAVVGPCQGHGAAGGQGAAERHGLQPDRLDLRAIRQIRHRRDGEIFEDHHRRQDQDGMRRVANGE